MEIWLITCCRQIWQRLRLLRRKPPLLPPITGIAARHNAQLDEEYRAVIRDLDNILAMEP